MVDIKKMPGEQVDYDQIAATYHQRYAINRLPGVEAALLALAQDLAAARVLEVGCGTGHWLTELQPIVTQVYGLDLSPGMLHQACLRRRQHYLTCGHASHLPFLDANFDLVFCVNALHHFDQPRHFIAEARRLVRPGGALAIIGMAPPKSRDDWYIYHYFEGVYETDLRRFPKRKIISARMAAAGFDKIEHLAVERIVCHQVGRQVLADHFLNKDSTSQLTLLSDQAYAAGLRRIEAALADAEAVGSTLVFAEDLTLVMLTGYRSESLSHARDP